MSICQRKLYAPIVEGEPITSGDQNELPPECSSWAPPLKQRYCALAVRAALACGYPERSRMVRDWVAAVRRNNFASGDLLIDSQTHAEGRASHERFIGNHLSAAEFAEISSRFGELRKDALSNRWLSGSSRKKKNPGGRPAQVAIFGDKVTEIRMAHSGDEQTRHGFAESVMNVSASKLRRAENDGFASKGFITELLRVAEAKGLKIKRKDLVKP